MKCDSEAKNGCDVSTSYILREWPLSLRGASLRAILSRTSSDSMIRCPPKPLDSYFPCQLKVPPMKFISRVKVLLWPDSTWPGQRLQALLSATDFSRWFLFPCSAGEAGIVCFTTLICQDHAFWFLTQHMHKVGIRHELRKAWKRFLTSTLRSADPYSTLQILTCQTYTLMPSPVSL